MKLNGPEEKGWSQGRVNEIEHLFFRRLWAGSVLDFGTVART